MKKGEAKKDNYLDDSGIRLRQIRIKNGMTQSELAHQYGCRTQYISSLETGKARMSHSAATKFGNIFGVKAAYFTGESEDEVSDTFTPEALRKLNDAVLDKVVASHFDDMLGISLQASYRKLNAEGRKYARDLLQMLTEVPRFTEPDPETARDATKTNRKKKFVAVFRPNNAGSVRTNHGQKSATDSPIESDDDHKTE